jgi:hypothetical protein
MIIKIEDYSQAVEHFNQEINSQTKNAPFIGDGALLAWCDECEENESIDVCIETGERSIWGDHVHTFEPSQDFKQKYLRVTQ